MAVLRQGKSTKGAPVVVPEEVKPVEVVQAPAPVLVVPPPPPVEIYVPPVRARKPDRH